MTAPREDHRRGTGRGTARGPKLALWARAAVWVLFVACGAGAFQLAGGMPGGDLRAAEAALAASTGAGTEISTDYGSWTADQRVAAGKLVNAYSGGKREGSYELDPFDLLPAHRWRGNTHLYASYGFTDIQESGMNVIASSLFLFAGWMWALLLTGLEAVLAFNVFSSRVGRIVNEQFAYIGGAFVSSGLVLIPIVLGLLYAVGRALRGDHAGTVTTLMGALLPIALLLALVNLTDPPRDGVDKDDYQAPGAGHVYTPTAGGPVWIAQTTVGLLDDLAGQFGTAFGAANGSAISQPGYALLNPSCVNYTNALYGTFGHWRSGRGEESGSWLAKGNPADTKAAGGLAVVSRLWERTFLTQWATAQYGNSRSGARIYCHQLDAQNGVPRAVQVEVGNAAGYPSIDSTATHVEQLLWSSDWDNDVEEDYGSRAATSQHERFHVGKMGIDSRGKPHTFPRADGDPKTFGKRGERRDPYGSIDRGSAKSWQASLFMWAACAHEGGSRNGEAPGPYGMMPQYSWAAAGELRGYVTTDSAYGDHCNVWWHLGLLPGEGSAGQADLLQWSRSLGADTAGSLSDGTWGMERDVRATMVHDSELHDDLGDIRRLVTAFRGDNSGQRVFAGLIALVTAAAYFWVLGGLALGGLLAKVGVAVLLMVLPGTLFLLAMPTKGRGRNPAGVKLLRMTGGFLAASVFLTVLITLMLTFIMLIESLLGGLGGGWLSLFVPLIALFVLRFILKKAGLGDLATLKGQLGMPVAAGAGAAAREGSRRFKAMQASKAIGGNGTSLKDQASRLGKVRDKRANRKAWDDLNDTPEGKRLLDDMAQTEEGRKKLDELRKAVGDEPIAKRLGALAAGAVGLDDLAKRAKIGPGAEAAGGWAAKTLEDLNKKAALGAALGLAADEALTDQAAAERISKLPPEQQRDAWDAHMQSKVDQLAAAQQIEIGPDGQILTTPGGDPIFGFHRIGEDGTRIPVTADTAGFDPRTGTVTDGYGIDLAPRAQLHPTEMLEARDKVAATYGLAGDQMLMSSRGLAPQAKLAVPTASDPSRLPHAQTLDGLAALAVQSEHWIPTEFKEALEKAPLSEEARAHAQALLAVQTGGVDRATGERVDFLAANGIDVNDPNVLNELASHVEGGATRFDSLHAPISGAAFAGVMSAALAYDRTRAPQSDVRDEALQEMRVAATQKSAGHVATLDAVRSRIADVGAKQQQIADNVSNGLRHHPANTALQAEIDQIVAGLAADVPQIMGAVEGLHGDAAVVSQIDLIATRAREGQELAADPTTIMAAASAAEHQVQQIRVRIEDAASSGSANGMLQVLDESIVSTIQYVNDVSETPVVPTAGPVRIPRAAEVVLARQAFVESVVSGAPVPPPVTVTASGSGRSGAGEDFETLRDHLISELEGALGESDPELVRIAHESIEGNAEARRELTRRARAAGRQDLVDKFRYLATSQR